MGLHNLAGMKSATVGTGTLTLTTAVTGCNTFANAGVVTGEVVRYTIRDGSDTESGYGTYTLSGLTLTRDTVESSTNGGSKISCSGNQFVFLTALASDMAQGWMPYAYPIGYEPSGTIASPTTLAANGGSYAAPVVLSAPMLLQSVSVRNYDTATERSWRWDLYYHIANDGLSSQNTLTRVAAITATNTFTPGAASTVSGTAGSAPVRLGPGLYWIVIQSVHATSTFGLAGITANAFAPNTGQTKTTTNPNGATLDFVAATWTAQTDVRCIRLNGRVFGQTAAF
jgi:hypothetical protein